MGISIGSRRYTIDGFKDGLVEAINRPLTDEEWAKVEKAMPYFGSVLENDFVVVQNEYYEDYNPYFQMFHFFGALFNVSDMWIEGAEYGPEGVNAADIWEELYGTDMPKVDEE